MTIEQLIEAVGEGFIPQDPAQLHATMEGMPDFFEKLSASLHEFGAFLGGLVGDETGAKMEDAGVHAGAAQGAAQEAFLAYQHEAQTWTSAP